MTTKVSIILPTYNGSKTIEKSIRSVIAQSFQDWELLIIDDGSIDNTKEIVDKFLEKDKRFIYLHQENKGQGPARKKGILLSRGEYIAFIDDDDVWVDNNKLDKQIRFLEKNSEYIVLGTCGIIEDENGQKISDFLVPETDEEIRSIILMRNPFILSSVMIRKEVLKEVTYFKEEEKHITAEDYSLWLKLSLLGKVANLKNQTVKYRYRADSIGILNKEHIFKNNINLIKEYKDKYPNYQKYILFLYFKYFLYRLVMIFGKNKKIIKFLFKQYKRLF